MTHRGEKIDWRAAAKIVNGKRVASGKWICLLCNEQKEHYTYNVLRHETTALHKSMVEYQLAVSESSSTSPNLHHDSATGLPPYLDMADSATRNLLQSMAGKRPQVPEAGDSSSNRSHSPIDNYPIDGWGVFEATQNTWLNQSAEQEGVALIAQSLLDRLDDLSGNESNNKRSDSEGEDIPEVVVPSASYYCMSIRHLKPSPQAHLVLWMQTLMAPHKSVLETCKMITPQTRLPNGIHGVTKL